MERESDFEGLLEALRQQLTAKTPGRWRMKSCHLDCDACDTSLVAESEYNGCRFVACGLLPEDARYVELVDAILPELLARYDMMVSTVGRPEPRWTQSPIPGIRTDRDGSHWVDVVLKGTRNRVRCGSLEDARLTLARLQNEALQA